MNTTFAVYPTAALHPTRERGRDLGALDPSRTVEMQHRWWSPSLGRQWYLQERPFGHSSRVRCSWISSSKTLWSPASHTRSCTQGLTTGYLVHQPVANWLPLCVVTDASSQELQFDPGVIPCLPWPTATCTISVEWSLIFPFPCYILQGACFNAHVNVLIKLTVPWAAGHPPPTRTD